MHDRTSITSVSRNVLVPRGVNEYQVCAVKSWTCQWFHIEILTTIFHKKLNLITIIVTMIIIMIIIIILSVIF